MASIWRETLPISIKNCNFKESSCFGESFWMVRSNIVQGFNWSQITPNWFVCSWTMDPPPSKVPLRMGPILHNFLTQAVYPCMKDHFTHVAKGPEEI